MGDDRAQYLLAGGDKLRVGGIADGHYLRRTGDEITGDVPSAEPAPGGSEAFPIGSVFIAVVSTNPAQLLGYGTWLAFGAGRVMIGFDESDADFDTAEKIGGAKEVASTGSVSQPTFTGDALGTHSHGVGTLAPSAHAGTAVSNHAGAAVADHDSHTHAYTQIVNHTHAVNITDNGHVHTQASQTATTGGASSWEHGAIDTSSTAAETLNTGSATTGISATTSNPAGSVASGTTAGPSAALSHSVTQPTNHTVTQPSDHTMSGSTSATSAGTPAGTVSQPAFAGDETSVVQPYIVCHFWKRTE